MKKMFWVRLLMITLVCAITMMSGAPSFAAKKYTFKAGHPHPEDSKYGEVANKFAELVGEKTDGKIRVNIYPNNQLGDWTETFELIMRGDVEMGFQIANANYDPKLNFAYYMPYVVKSVEEAKKAYAPGGWAYDIIKDLWAEHGIKALAVYPVGLAGMSTKGMPPAPGDPNVSKGHKIRIMPIETCKLVYESLGYMTTSIPWAEAYSALQTGIADGEMGGNAFQGWQFRDVNDVWIQYNDFFDAHWIVINMKRWDKLTPEQQVALTEAAQEVSEMQWENAVEEETHYMNELKAAGWTIVTLSDEELQACADKVRAEVWPQMKEMLGDDLYDRVVEAVRSHEQ